MPSPLGLSQKAGAALAVHVTAILQPSSTGWLDFAETNGTVARAVALGMTSSELLAQIAAVSEYVPRGHSCESR